MQAHAWILDVAHRARRFSCDVPTGVRPLAAVQAAAQRELGIALDGPLGITGAAAAERDGTPIPHVGLVSIVTDGFGYPRCASRSEKVELRRFADVDAELAWVEGEGDRTLEDWREGHLAFFHREAPGIGLSFSEEETVFFEHFRVLAVLGRAGG